MCESYRALISSTALLTTIPLPFNQRFRVIDDTYITSIRIHGETEFQR